MKVAINYDLNDMCTSKKKHLADHVEFYESELRRSTEKCKGRIKVNDDNIIINTNILINKYATKNI